ncbi:hypothetical protein KC874_01830 [Candidatus Saccharibacteria bacterium]|jgi:cation transport ATPase|nr:hypothetical protein [Candidatus Saccharibacteria bacterium]
MELKKYLQDRPILFLNLAAALLAVFNVLATLLRIDTTSSTTIVRYEVWKGLTGGVQASVYELYSFALMSLIIFIGGAFFAYRLSKMNRNYSVLTMFLVVIALIFNIIVSGAILNLQ